jgi:hypothetical protein
MPRPRVLADRYRLIGPRSSDTETETWEAHDLALDRRVLVDVLRLSSADESAATARFWRSARAAAQESPAAGPRVLDGGTDLATGRAFVVREWVDHRADEEPNDAPRVARGARLATWRGVVDHLALDSPRLGRWPVLGAAVVVLAVGAFVTSAGMRAWLAWINEPLAQQRSPFSLAFPPAPAAVPVVGARTGEATATPAAPPPTVVAAQRPIAAATPNAGAIGTPTATPVPAAGRRTIVNTDGQGVALRNAPGGDRLRGKGYDEGVSVTVLESSGAWTHIRGDDGREGWILTVTLAP